MHRETVKKVNVKFKGKTPVQTIKLYWGAEV